VIVQALAQPDRFSGGLRLKIQQIWDLPAARCRFGKYLRVAVNGQAPAIAQLVREFPPRREETDQGELVRGLTVRLMVKRPGAQCELQLDDRAQFFPTDAALASWMAQAHERQAEIVFD
jgi:DNA polymerase III subunit alpha